MRPDSTVVIDKVAVIRGEEKSSSEKKDPKEELADKLNWTYSPAPYVLGISHL
jgi:hypothetical protein